MSFYPVSNGSPIAWSTRIDKWLYVGKGGQGGLYVNILIESSWQPCEVIAEVRVFSHFC